MTNLQAKKKKGIGAPLHSSPNVVAAGNVEEGGENANAVLYVSPAGLSQQLLEKEKKIYKKQQAAAATNIRPL